VHPGAFTVDVDDELAAVSAPFDALAGTHASSPREGRCPMGDVERVYRTTPTVKLKSALVEASRLARDYARAYRDSSTERAMHQTIDMILDELELRGELR
jgi:hypothetical protein